MPAETLKLKLTPEETEAVLTALARGQADLRQSGLPRDDAEAELVGRVIDRLARALARAELG